MSRSPLPSPFSLLRSPLHQAQRRQAAVDVPVLCVSGAGEKVVAQALRLGAKECIAKPTDFDALVERVTHYRGG